MSYLASSSFLRPTERIGQGEMSGESESQSPHTPSIHVLDDDSLLNVFYLYRPFLSGEDDNDEDCFKGGEQHWGEECWWYKLTHVCQRWQNLIFRSAYYLGLSLLCTKGTPVADMLTHSSWTSSLPLAIDYVEKYLPLAAEDEEGAILALKQQNRVRRIRLFMPAKNLQRFIDAIEEEYPILESLIVLNRIKGNIRSLIFPETLEAPHLHHLVLVGFALSIASRLLTSAVGLVTLCLDIDHPSVYFHPDFLLQWLSFMPQLESLMIGHFTAFPERRVERQTPVTLPNLHHFSFKGYSTYLEAFVHLITACPEKIEISFSDRRTLSIPRLLQFMNTTWNLKFESAKVKFSEWQSSVVVYPHGEAEMYALSVTVFSEFKFEWLLFYVAQVSNSFGQILSAVERLTLEREDEIGSQRAEEYWRNVDHNGVDPIKWRRLLSSFSNVKTLRIGNTFVEGVSRFLQLEDGELPLELLPELRELAYSGSGETGDGFNSFIDVRQKAGRPVALIRY
ncbi:hypothetical protein DFH94DRAFT_280558 [Russula ochroleuca]|uniref:Uncharacterized protein n=1 Tax=Russula ochroleuca TaxID=152965 RepID=A0A9P5MPD0_9AGAM|nr:hypothetical protein DFH94DRAFT_280558 [Russula ochroleuca]